MKRVKNRIGLLCLVCALVSFTPAGSAVAGDSLLVVAPGGKVEEVYFPSNEVAIATDYTGLAKITAKMDAFSIPDGKTLWHLEVPVGQKFQLLKERVFFDDMAGWFFIGNGPVTAVEASTGTVKWTLPFKETGVVRWVRPGAQSLLVLGADRDDAVNNYDDLKKHFEKPLLLCVSKADGKIIWKYRFECPEDPGDVHALHAADPADVDALVPDYGRGVTIIKGRYIYCIDNKSGQELWKTKEKACGEPVILDDRVIANLDKRAVALNLSNGAEQWRCEKTVEKTSGFQPLPNGTILAIFSGEFKDGRNAGDYKFFCISPADGGLLWQFGDGKDFIAIQEVEDSVIHVADAESYRVLRISDGKELLKARRDKDYAMGSWYFESQVIDIGEKGIASSSLDRKGVLWETKFERAKRGQSFMMKMLKGLSTAMSAASSSMNQDRSPRRAVQEHMRRKEQKKQQEKYNPSDRKRYESELWKRPYRDTDFGTTAIAGSVVVFPTHGKGIVGVAQNTGAVVWTVETTESDPMPYFSDDCSVMAIPDGEKLLIKVLE